MSLVTSYGCEEERNQDEGVSQLALILSMPTGRRDSSNQTLQPLPKRCYSRGAPAANLSWVSFQKQMGDREF
jgi:hypothetical protein